MRNLLVVIMTAAALASAADAPKKPEPIHITGLRELATFDPQTGAIEYVKGATPEEAITALVYQIANLNQQLQACQKPKAPKESKK